MFLKDGFGKISKMDSKASILSQKGSGYNFISMFMTDCFKHFCELTIIFVIAASTEVPTKIICICFELLSCSSP